jgi:acetoin:2,6-dichlorophenolindophenol oxidoreductase subunit beta
MTETCSYADALFETMQGALAGYDHTIIMGQGVDDHKGTFGSTLGLADRFGPERVMDMPLAEEAMTGIAAGAALNGMYPITTHIRADFAFLATNQIINLIAKYKYMFGGLFEVPMLIRAVIGRSWGQGAQHSQSPQSQFAHVPGLTVVMPADCESILAMYPEIIANHPGPVLSLEHRLLYDIDFTVDRDAVRTRPNKLGTQRVRAGTDVTIVATSVMVLEAHRAAKHLAEAAGIDCEIIDLNSVSHPDHTMILDSVRKTGRLIVADTSWRPYGVAAEIARLVCETDPGMLKAPSVSLGMADAPCPAAKALEDIYYPNLTDFTHAIACLVKDRIDHGVDLPDETSMRDVYTKFRGPF